MLKLNKHSCPAAVSRQRTIARFVAVQQSNTKNGCGAKLIFFFLLLIACSLLITQKARAAEFNPNYIISDAEILDSAAMTAKDIQQFLEAKGGFLAKYSCPNADGVMKTAAEIIYDAAANNYDCDGATLSASTTLAEKKQKCKPISINPRFLLVLLQKEQSLITDPAPKQSQLDWAVGYGCPDGQSCNTRWQGFGKQINSAALQFYDYMSNPNYYTYKANITYTVANTGKGPSIITPANQATAALYNYTPHVYNGNFNFYNLWQSYFTINYLDGSLLQAHGEPGVWLIQNGQKRPFTTKGALTTRFDINKIITVNKSDLDKFTKGAPIKFPQYSLIRSPRGTIFLLDGNKRRGITTSEAFSKIGFNPQEVVDASWEDVNAYIEGESITASSTYPTGALLQNKITGGVYWVSDNLKAPLLDAVLLKTKFKNLKIHAVEPAQLDKFTTTDPVKFGDGELLKSVASSAVYVISNGVKHSFSSGKAFEGLGYKWENIIIVSPKLIALYKDGNPITEEFISGASTKKTADESRVTKDNEQVISMIK